MNLRPPEDFASDLLFFGSTDRTFSKTKMETRARKRVRVQDYEHNDAVVERSAKRAKREVQPKKEMKKEVKIKPEPKNNRVKKESKNQIKSEVKKEVKKELKKEKQEKKIKPEHKLKIKKEPGMLENSSDSVEASMEDISDEDASASGSEDAVVVAQVRPISTKIDDDDKELRNKPEDGQAKYNFSSFKTIVVGSGTGQRWSTYFTQPQMRLNNGIIEKIMSVSDVPQIMIWSRVSKSSSNLAHGAQSLWQKLFRQHNWRLPHEIRNKNFFYKPGKPIPPLRIKDSEVDWFSEFKRNFIMCAKIRRVIDDIVREDEDYEVLEEEDLRNWEDENDYYLPNDMREYFKSYADGLCTENLEEFGVLTHEMGEIVTLNGLYMKHGDDDDEDDPGKPDNESLSKLLDLPQAKVKERIFGILIVETSRNYGTVYVPYLNTLYEDQGEEDVRFFSKERTILQDLQELRQENRSKK